MHLTDEQLLDLSKVDQLHLSECEECQQQLLCLKTIREQMATLPILKQPKDNWMEIQKLHKKRQQEQQLQKTHKKMNYWRVTSIALAASLTIVIFWPKSQLFQPDVNAQNKQLALLIEQNNFLQKQLNKRNTTFNLSNVDFNYLQSELNTIDQILQRAYLQQSSSEEKTRLWKNRQEIIKQLLSTTEQKKSIRI